MVMAECTKSPSVGRPGGQRRGPPRQRTGRPRPFSKCQCSLYMVSYTKFHKSNTEHNCLYQITETNFWLGLFYDAGSNPWTLLKPLHYHVVESSRQLSHSQARSYNLFINQLNEPPFLERLFPQASTRNAPIRYKYERVSLNKRDIALIHPTAKASKKVQWKHEDP